MILRILTALHQFVHAGGRRFAMSVSLIGSIAALGVMFARPALSESGARLTADDVTRRFCAPPPTEAQVRAEDVSNEEVSVRVPSEDIAYGWNSATVAVGLGDVVKLTVFSDQAGAAGVHGLSTIEAIHPWEAVAIRFRAIHSGRFPLHFHGTGGSHFELMAVNVTVEPDARAHN
jgi:hypothetical protein